MTTDTAATPTTKKPLTAGTIVKRTFLSILAIVGVVIIVAAALIGWTIQRAFPTYSGTVAVSGITETVSIQRNDQGVPTITADNTDDLFFAQGYAHAQDRFWEMDFRRHVTAGRVAELFGESQLGTDQFLRSLDWHGIAAQEYEQLDEASRSYYDAYAKGVNEYLAEHKGGDLAMEYTVLGFTAPGYEPEKWTPVDSIAWLKAMAWDLRTNIEDETERALLLQNFTPDQVQELYPDYPFDKNPTIIQTEDAETASGAGGSVLVPTVGTDAIEWSEAGDVLEAVEKLVGDAGEGVGSNSWVVSGEHTESGLPLLANDPHLGAALPSVWTQMHLRCSEVSESCPFDVAGFSFSGLPGIVIGHNDTVAWGFTNLTTDVADLYVERVQGDQYWRDGKLVDFEEREETFKVAGGKDVTMTVRTTVHGPVVSGLTGDFTAIADGSEVEGAPEGDSYALSLKWTALEASTTPAAIFALNTAKNIEDFRAAAALFAVPAQNLVYADTEGNIAYQAPGSLPIRGAGDGWIPQPGWDSAYDWTGYIPFEDLPFVENPSSGFIVTANAAIVDDSFEYFLSRDWDYGYRAARITSLIEGAIAEGKVTAQTMRDIQMDQEMWIGKRLMTAIEDLSSERPGPQAALGLLDEWDAQNSKDSPAAAYANVLWDTLATAMFADRENPAPLSGQARLFTVVDALLDNPDSEWWVNEKLGISSQEEMLEYAIDTAYDRLAELQGEDVTKWSWGSLHALTLRTDTFGSSGIAPLEWLFNRGPYNVGGGASVVDATGWTLGESFETTTVPSMRMVIDLDNWDRSTYIHLTGTSGHAFHPNYVDQTPMWADGEQLPWTFSKKRVAAETVDTLTLTPKK